MQVIHNIQPTDERGARYSTSNGCCTAEVTAFRRCSQPLAEIALHYWCFGKYAGCKLQCNTDWLLQAVHSKGLGAPGTLRAELQLGSASNNNGKPPGAAAAVLPLTELTMAAVAQHNTCLSCWLVIKGQASRKACRKACRIARRMCGTRVRCTAGR